MSKTPPGAVIALPVIILSFSSVKLLAVVLVLIIQVLTRWFTIYDFKFSNFAFKSNILFSKRTCRFNIFKYSIISLTGLFKANVAVCQKSNRKALIFLMAIRSNFPKNTKVRQKYQNKVKVFTTFKRF